jgi:cyclic pyranopterin phosphate synthase
MKLMDSHGRRIRYLRLSVTDRCNMRCRYCMPAEGVPKRRHDDILSYEELFRVASEAVAMGIEKIRVTGGEPLVRKGIIPFLERLSQLNGLRELVLTTNGMLLEETAADLRRAGVNRLNISLDSLVPQRFSDITRGGDLKKVLSGIEAAMAAGFPAPKLNMVVMRGVNDDEVLDFAALTLSRPFTVRFIEYMPNLRQEGWRDRIVTGGELLARIEDWYRLTPLVGADMAGPARNFKIAGAAGTIGVITPLSGHFCDSCNRIRVSADGHAHSCLFAGGSTDLKPALRSRDVQELRRTLYGMVVHKPKGHQLGDEEGSGRAFAMSSIGG